MFSKAPASQQFNNIVLTTDYSVESQDELYVTVSTPKPETESLGKLFVFDNGVLGTVTANSPKLIVKLQSYVLATVVSPYLWLPTMNTTRYYVKPNTVVGSVSIQSRGLLLNNLGYLGWSLYNEQGVLLLAANDNKALGLCSYESTSSWLPGNYKLEVREFSKENMQSVAYGYKWYSILEPTELLQDIHSGVLLL